MQRLAWATNAQRAEEIRRYMEQHGGMTMTDAQQQALSACTELLDAEQGVYFFKEALKFLYQATEATITEAQTDDGHAKTPYALRDAVKAQCASAGEKATEVLMQLLSAYDGTTYNPAVKIRTNDVNDYLYLALAGPAFVAYCADGRRVQQADASPAEAEGVKQLVQRYARYKATLAMQETERSKMNARYGYCVRNLQRRYPLATALDVMNRYNRGFEESPLAAMGVTREQLKRLYMYLEDKK